jgi:hypothetical protein
MKHHKVAYRNAVTELVFKIAIFTGLEKQAIIKKSVEQSEIVPFSVLNVLEEAVILLSKGGKVSWL